LLGDQRVAGSAAARLPIVGHVGFYLTVFLICSGLPTINTGSAYTR
jgi:hypothetical protein